MERESHLGSEDAARRMAARNAAMEILGIKGRGGWEMGEKELASVASKEAEIAGMIKLTPLPDNKVR